MKSIHAVFLCLLSMDLDAKVRDCHQKVTQAEKNECMTLEKDKAVGQLMKKLAEDCANAPRIHESEGGSIYPMLLDECLTKKLETLAKRADRLAE